MRRLRAPFREIGELSGQVRSMGGNLRFECKVWGTSMSPEVCPGDVLVVQSAGPDDVEIGDIIVYLGDHGRQVVHRLVEKDTSRGATEIIARSDVLGARNEVIKIDDLIGRVVSVERGNPLRRFLDGAIAALRRRLSGKNFRHDTRLPSPP